MSTKIHAAGDALESPVQFLFTGGQASESGLALPMAPGKLLAREFEYRRHGTRTLIAALNVSTGKVFAHGGQTRTEEDFAEFIETLIRQHPGYRTYHIVFDQPQHPQV